MSYRGRNYINGNTEYRGVVTETGTRMTHETVYDETEEEYAARKSAWLAANPGRATYNMTPWYRAQHQEERGLQPYENVNVYGPYATIGPARRAAGTGRNNSATVETGTRRDGGEYTRIRKVQIGTVEWKDAEQ